MEQVHDQIMALAIIIGLLAFGAILVAWSWLRLWDELHALKVKVMRIENEVNARATASNR